MEAAMNQGEVAIEQFEAQQQQMFLNLVRQLQIQTFLVKRSPQVNNFIYGELTKLLPMFKEEPSGQNEG
jgi:hypothetical protein